MDGYTVTKYIRRKDSTIPIYGMSAHASQEYREKCITAGMNGSISKPIIASELLKIVQDRMKQKKC